MKKYSEDQIMTMWRDWKRDPNDKDRWQSLYKAMKPDIEAAMRQNTFRSKVPIGAHFAEAVQNYDNAIKSYTPNKSTKLSSWVRTNVGQKGKRLEVNYGNTAAIPEQRFYKVKAFQNGIREMEDKLGREPSTVELAAHLDWDEREVTRMRKELRSQLVASEEIASKSQVFPADVQTKINYLGYDLSPQEHLIYEYVFGKNGRPRVSDPNQISKMTKIPTQQVRNVINRIRQKYMRL